MQRRIEFEDEHTWPDAVVALLRDKRGYPIPYTTYVDRDGVPDFRVLDAERRFDCYKERLCGVCGTVMGYWIIFIGGPACEKSRCFLDPPMHPDCADFALSVCPHLINARARYSQRPVSDEIVVTTMDVTRPEVFKRFRTRDYEMVHMPGSGDIVLHSAPFVDVQDIAFKKGV